MIIVETFLLLIQIFKIIKFFIRIEKTNFSFFRENLT